MKILERLGDFFQKLSAGEIAIGLIFSAIAQAFGGWSEGLTALVVFMCIDYITGLLVAGVFHASNKTENGGLESRAGWKGIIRKVTTLMIVLVAAYVDRVMGMTFVRDAVIIGFLANEAISIIENAGLMGLPLPKAVTNMIDLLKIRADEKAEEIKAEEER